MKTIIKTLILLVTNIAIAQYPVIHTISFANPNDYVKIGNNGTYVVDTNNERNQYVGLWQYNQNGLFLKLKIEKVDQRLSKSVYQGPESSYYFKDIIIIKYKLEKNGIVLYDNLNETNLDNIYSSGTKRSIDNYLDGHFLEYSRNINSYYTITRLGTFPETINFNLSRFLISRINPSSFYNDGQPLFNIPTMGLILTKM